LIFSRYLAGAKKRYLERAEEYIQETQRRSISKQFDINIIDWSSLRGQDIEVRKIRELAKSIYREQYNQIGQEEINKVMQEADLDSIQFKSGDALERHLEKISREITKTTIDKIEKAVKKGEEEGASKDEILDSIRDSVAFDESRAQTIARTESTKVINSAINEAYKQAGDNGVKLEKVWITENDDAVRETHIELDGVTIPVNEDFVSSSGATTQSPASFGVAAEDINCRCTMQAMVVKE
tara:strand:- start:666 stop:1385 length:720 start_codon:yes stop_codon:yes gene_type:complete